MAASHYPPDMGTIPYSPTSGVIITGGGSGIGRATALALAEAGRPVACWDVNADSAAAVAEEATTKFDVPAIGLGIDVRNTREFPGAIDRSRDTMGSVGGLVHCAGIIGAGYIDALDEAVWD